MEFSEAVWLFNNENRAIEIAIARTDPTNRTVKREWVYVPARGRVMILGPYACPESGRCWVMDAVDYDDKPKYNVRWANTSSIGSSYSPKVTLFYADPEPGKQNRDVFLINSSNNQIQIRVRITIMNSNPTPSIRPFNIGAKGKLYIGGTCAGDIQYSTACGSTILYEILS